VEAPGGVEPPTCGLGNRRSIHLSYGASVHLIVANQVLVATAYNRRTSISKIETGQPSVFRLVWRAYTYISTHEATFPHGFVSKSFEDYNFSQLD
jgi:hypothetical protein